MKTKRLRIGKTKNTINRIAFLFAVSFLLAGHTLSAQDTLYSNTPDSAWFYDRWINDDTVHYTYALNYHDEDIVAKRMFTDDTLIVYGIVATMTTYCRETAVDTDTTKLSEYLILYEAGEENPVQIGESLLVQATDPPDYYWDCGKSRWNGPIGPIPVQERYFSTPQVVADSFYVGFTMYGFYELPSGLPSRCEFGPSGIALNNSWPIYTEPAAYYRRPGLYNGSGGWPDGWRYGRSGIDYHIMIYPILTPNPDSTGTGGEGGGEGSDTLAIGQNELLQRHVSLSPNPADEYVRILSSFNLSSIDLYDLSGRRLLTLQASGHSARLDTRTLPRGTYTLRIHTSMGTAAKRLILQ